MSSVSSADFVRELVRIVPTVAPIVEEHFADVDELLIHLLMPDILRFATARFTAGDLEVSAKVLAIVASALSNGDEGLRNAVEVSFVEDVGAWDGETPEFIASWPKVLLDERERQHTRPPFPNAPEDEKHTPPGVP